MKVGLRKGMIFAGCESFWVFMEGLLMTWLLGFVFEGLGWKSWDVQRSPFLWDVPFSLLPFLPSLLITFSYRGQNQERAPP